MKKQITHAQYPLVIACIDAGANVNPDEIMYDLDAAGYKATHLRIMELVLKMYPQYQDGLPINDRAYTKLLNKELGLQLLQGFIDLDLLPKHLHSVLPAQK